MMKSEDLTRRFLAEYHPDILAAQEEEHLPEPMPPFEPGHECGAYCVCNRCWKFFSQKPHPRFWRRYRAEAKG